MRYQQYLLRNLFRHSKYQTVTSEIPRLLKFTHRECYKVTIGQGFKEKSRYWDNAQPRYYSKSSDVLQKCQMCK